MSARLFYVVSLLLVTLSACRSATDPAAQVAPGRDAGVETPGELCNYAALGADACNGKRVEIKARASRFVQQHPMLSMELQQSYWDTDRSQMIFLSAEPLPCRNGITAIGILRARVGPCDPNAQNKNQYCGTALEVQTYECR